MTYPVGDIRGCCCPRDPLQRAHARHKVIFGRHAHPVVIQGKTLDDYNDLSGARTAVFDNPVVGNGPKATRE